MKSSADNPLDRVMLLFVDVQSGFLPVMAGGPSFLQRCCFTLEAALGFGMPVLFTEQVPQKLGSTAPELGSLAENPRVISKNTFSALDAAEVRAALAENGSEHLLLCGLETPVCIYQTAVSALAADLEVTLLTDCLAARRSADAASALTALARAGCHCLPSETVFYSLLRDTDHPFFRSFTRLVKKYAA